MFGIAWSEFLLIGIVALVVVPPKDLPVMMRTVGRWVGQMKRMASDFQYQVSSALREAEIEDLRKSVEDLTAADPMRALRNELDEVAKPLEDLTGKIKSDLTSPPEVKSFPPGEPSAAPMSLAPATAEETATPPGAAAFPGAMAEAHAKEAAVHDEVGERLAELQPIPVETRPLEEELVPVRDAAAETSAATPQTIAAGSR